AERELDVLGELGAERLAIRLGEISRPVGRGGERLGAVPYLEIRRELGEGGEGDVEGRVERPELLLLNVRELQVETSPLERRRGRREQRGERFRFLARVAGRGVLGREHLPSLLLRLR